MQTILEMAFPVKSPDMKIAPLFDLTGAILPDPTGSIFYVIQSGDNSTPVTGADVKVPPVFDATDIRLSVTNP
jgi:hypothetical protein